MPYSNEMEIRARMSLDTRRALAAGEELGYNLNRLLSETSLRVNSDSITKANKDVIQLQQNLQAALNPTRGTVDLAMLDTQMQKSGKSLTAYAASLSKYGQEGAEAYLSLTKAISSAEAPTTRLSQNLKNAGDQLKRTIGWQLSSSAIHGVMSTYSQAIGYAKELNRSLTDIRIVTSQSNAQMAQFAKYANVAAKGLSSTTTRYTDAALIYYQQGLTEKSVKDRTDVTIKMANVAGVSAEKASQQLTSIWNNFYDGSKSLEHYADVMVKLGAETASSTDEISRGMQKFAAIGNTVGLSYEYAASALATVTATTRESADTVGTSFRTLFSRLQGLSLGETLEDGTTLNKYSKALNTIGVRIKETNGEMKSMNDILDEIGAKWNTLSKDTQIGLAQSIGGARQYSTFMALMDNWDYFQENVNRANNASGALQQQQEIYAESWEASSKRVQTAMESIFDSVINDKFAIGLNNVLAGALNGVNGLINGFGGLGGAMTSVSGIFMAKYAKEMPRVMEELRYNANYLFNGKTGALNIKQSNVFAEAEKGLNVFAQANNISRNVVDESTGQILYESLDGDNMVLAQQLNNAKASMDRRQQYLAIENTLSKQEKEAYQNKLAVLDMWDNSIIAQAQQTQNQVNILKTERKAEAIDTQSQIKSAAKEKLAYDTYKSNAKYQITDGKNTYDLTTAEGRKAYTESLNKKYGINAINKAKKSDRTKMVAERDAGFAVIAQAEKAGQRFANSEQDFSTSAIPQLSQAEEKMLRSSMGESDFARFQSAMTKTASGQALLSTENSAMQTGLMHLQEPVVKVAEGMGRVDGALTKFDQSIKASRASTVDFGKDLKASVSLVEKEYKSYLGTIGEVKDGQFKLNDAYAQKLGDNAESFTQGINKTLQELSGAQTKFNANGTVSDVDGLKKIIEGVKDSATTVLETAEGKADRKVSSDVITEAREAGQEKFKLDDASNQRKKEMDASQIKHETDVAQQMMQVASTAMMATSAMQSSMTTYQTLKDKNATGFEKTMAVAGNVTTGLMLAGSMKQTGAALAANAAQGSALSSIGGALAGPWGMIASIALSVLPAVFQFAADKIESTDEKNQRHEEEYATIKELVDSSRQKQEVFSNITQEYNNNIEKFRTTEAGSIENIRALSSANEQAMSIIEDNNLSSSDYHIGDDGLITVNSNALQQIEEDLSQQTLKYQAENGITNVTKLLRDRTENDEQYYRPVLTELGTMAPVDKQAIEGQLEYAKDLEAQGIEWGSDYYEDITKAYQSREKENTQIISAYNQALLNTANADGFFDKSDKTAIATLTQNASIDDLKQMQLDLDAKFDKTINETEASLRERATGENEFGASVMSEEEFEKILDSQEYKDLKAQDEQKAIDFLGAQIKNQAYLNEYSKLIEQAKKEEKELDSKYNREALEDMNMATLKELVSEGGTLYDNGTGALSKEYNFALAQYNKTALDFYKAVGEYLPNTSFDGALEQFTLQEAEVLSETLQEFGDTFGKEAAQSIYNATLKAEGVDRDNLLNSLKSIDFSGSTLQSLNQVYELSEKFDGLYTDLFTDIKNSFGGDAGLFKEIANDKSVQKMLANFEKLGDIDADAIVQAAHSSADLAMALDMAGFNAGGLAAALEGIASGTIEQGQVTNGLLAGLSVLNEADSIRANAYDSIDSYDKGRSVTDIGKFTGNLAKTIDYNLTNGYMFDETLMNAWGEIFGENKKYELKQDFINWQSGNKNDISKNFNDKYKAEKEFLEAMQKNPYDLSAQWKYAFDSSQVEENERYNDEWVRSEDTEEDTKNVSYNTVGEDEYNRYLEIGEKIKDGTASALEETFYKNVGQKVQKENDLKNSYVNIDGAMYKIGDGDRDVHWDEQSGKWLGKDNTEITNDNALFGWDYKNNQLAFTDYFEKSDISYQELKDMIMLNLGQSEASADRMLADAMAQNTTLQKLYGDGQVNEAVATMSSTAADNDEWITADQMEVMFQSSDYLKNKYQAGGYEGWIADYITGADLKRPEEADYGEDIDKYFEAMDKYWDQVNERKDFQSRYINFGNTDLRTASFEEADQALKANTGLGTLDRLKSSRVKIKEEYDTRYVASSSGHQNLIVGRDVEKEGYDLSDTMQQLIAMGYSQTQAYEAMGKIMSDDNKVLIESVRDVDGNVQTYSTESKAYQDWAKQHGIEDSEQNAEAFSNFISEQDAVAKEIQKMAIEAQAREQYNQLYNADGTRKTDDKGNPINPDGTPEGDTETVDEDIGTDTTESDTGSAAGAAETKQQQATGGDNGASSTSGNTQKSNGILTDSEKNQLVKYGTKDKDGNWVVDLDKWYADGGESTGYSDVDIQKAADKINEENKRKELEAYAVGKNQNKIKKHYAVGKTHKDPYEGLAQVGEEGPELSVDKDGNATMLGVNGPTYAYVEKDDIIFTADETEDILKANPDLNNIPGFSEGMSGSQTIISVAYGNDNIWNGSGSGDGNGGGDEDDDWEPDRYVVILEQLQDLQREYARLVKAKERAYGADKIKALDAEIAKTNELIKAQKSYISEIQQYKEKDIQKMKDLGIDVDKEFIFDKNGVIRNFDEISAKYKKAAEEGDETAAKQYEAILKYMETNNLLEEQMDALIDMQWQLMDARIERITTKVDIKMEVDDTDLQYVSYLLGKINEEAYDVAKALSLIGESMEISLSKVSTLRQGLSETLVEAFTELNLSEDAQTELLKKIETGTLTQEDLDNFAISPDHSANIMSVLLDYRQQLITLNQQIDQLRDQVTEMVEKHFSNFKKDVSDQTSLINTYTNTLNVYSNLIKLLDSKFAGNMYETLNKINDVVVKNAKDNIKNTEITVKAAELKYKELDAMYKEAAKIGDQDTMDKVAAAREKAYKELQESNNQFAQAWLSANEAVLKEFQHGVEQAVEEFEKTLSPLFGSVESLSAAFERQNIVNSQYVDDYEKYYQLNKLNRDLQTAIDETDNINSKKALSKLQDEINKKKNSENQLSEYDLETLKNKVELEKARLALDEAKNAKSTVTLARDQNGNWGYVYTAEEDKVAKAEQDYEDKLYQYQQANQKYIDDLQAKALEAQSNMLAALAELDVNDANYEQNKKHIIDSFTSQIAYFEEQLQSALGNQESTRLTALEQYDTSMINLKTDFEDLTLSMITGEKSLQGYFNTIQTSLPTLLAQLKQLEEKYDNNIKEINDYVTGNQNIADYMDDSIDMLADKSEEAKDKIQGLYTTMVDELGEVNKEIADIYQNYLPKLMEMTQANETLAESISKIQHELSDLSEVETPPVFNYEEWLHPEGYTENDYGVIRKLTDAENKILEEVQKELQIDDKGVITNYDELKEKWYEEPPAEGEEDKRDADKKAKWDLLQKLINYGNYRENANTSIGMTSVNQIIQSNAVAMYNALASAVAQGVTATASIVDQTVTITAEFPNVTDRNEILEALNNIVNDSAQWANRKR